MLELNRDGCSRYEARRLRLADTTGQALMSGRAESMEAPRPANGPKTLPGAYPMRTDAAAERYDLGVDEVTIEYAPGRILIGHL